MTNLDPYGIIATSRKTLEDEISNCEQRMKWIQKELDRRESKTDEYKVGFPITVQEGSGLTTRYAVFSNIDEAVKAYLNRYPDNDQETAFYRVHKVYL